jgi:hypothetical protein
MPTFDVTKCKIPTVYCGDKRKIPKSPDPHSVYTRVGTRSECLKKGIGYGLNQRKYGPDSIRLIKYIGKQHALVLAKQGIKTCKQLVAKVKKLKSKETWLSKVLEKTDGSVDGRAYNSVLIYLYLNGVTNLPPCKKLKM